MNYEIHHKQINSLQGIRAISFLGIFLSHLGITSFGGLGPWGVSSFLLLSGFLLTINHYEKEDSLSVKNAFAFSLKRIGKLYDLHIITLLIAFLLFDRGLLSNNGVLNTAKLFLCNALLLQSWVPNSKVYFSFNFVSWYLPVCLVCYLLFPFVIHIIRARKKNNYIYIFAWIIFQVALTYASSLVPNDILGSNGFTKWFVYICPLVRVIDFIIGCELGVCYYFNKGEESHNNSNGRHSTIFIIIFISLITISLLIYNLFYPKEAELAHQEIWWLYSCIFTIPNCGLIYYIAKETGFFSRVLSNKIIVKLGNLSGYAFLIHQIVIRFFRLIASRLGVDGVAYIGIAFIAFAFTIALSVEWNKMKVYVQGKRC